MHDVLQKYYRKDTALKRYEDIRNETPTTVICFKPFIKQSVLEKYNISLYDYQTLLKLQKFPKSWTDFYIEAFYHLNEDFNISLRDHPNLSEGLNQYEENSLVKVETLLTLWFGVCYKISAINFTENDQLIFRLNFNHDTHEAKDIPKPEIYITSEDNAYGILAMNWMNGNELKFSVHAMANTFTIHAIKHKMLGMKSYCLNDVVVKSYDEDLIRMVESTNFECENLCFPITFSNMKNITRLASNCSTFEDYKCMKFAFHKVLYYSAKDVITKRCQHMEYHGRLSFEMDDDKLRNDFREWRYVFMADTVEVNEEYLVYDFSGLVGSIGGTFGLFIGFSFREVANNVIKFIQMLIVILQKRQNV